MAGNQDFSLFNHIPLGVIVLNRNYEIVFWNQFLESWSKIPKQEVVGRNLFETYPRLNNVKYKARLDAVLSGGAPATFTSLLHQYLIPIELEEGGFARQTVIAKHLRGENSEDRNILLVLQNTTEADKRSLQIKELREKTVGILKTSNEALEEFSLLVSHDLKVPLRTINFYVDEVVEGQTLNEEASSNLGKIKSVVKKMNSMISSLFMFSQVGQMNDSDEEFELSSLLEELQSTFLPILKDSNTELRLKGPFPSLRGDKSRISELFHNLVENALKYNDKPSRWIEIGHIESSEGHQLYVADNGIGIDEDRHSSIFRMFSQIDKEVEGIGAGLALVKKIVERHGGRIWVESEPGKGSKFIFSLRRD